MDLARLGVDEVGLDLVAVAAEESVGERAVAPVDAGSMQVDEERRHRVEQPLAVRPGSEREPHQQAAVLDRVGEVLGREDRLVAARPRRQADGRDGRQTGRLEPAQDVELGGRDMDGLFLERDDPIVLDEEADEMARRADRQLPEGQAVRPVGQRQVPRQVEQSRAAAAQSQAREARAEVVRQSFFRRYAVTVES